MTESILGNTLDPANPEPVVINQASRREGLYVIGASGTGKSILLENLILQDINQGLGVCVLDPHGDLINGVIARMKKRLDQVILIDLDSREYVAGINLFHCTNPSDAFLFENVVQAFMHIFEKVYEISRETPLLNQFFLNIAKTMIYNPTATILDIPRLLTDWNFRNELLKNVPEDNVRWFWVDFYEHLNKSTRLYDAISAISNKLVEFESRVLKPWFGQKTQTINMRTIMDERKILLIKLKARWQGINSLLGSIFVAQLLDAAYSRQDIQKNKRKQFNIYCDEFQSYASRDFAQLFTEARKYGIGITIAHQVYEQLDLTIKATIKQAANIVVFRLSHENSAEIAGAFDTTPPLEPKYTQYDERLWQRAMDQEVYRSRHPLEYIEYWSEQWAEKEFQRLGKNLCDLRSILLDFYAKYSPSSIDIDTLLQTYPREKKTIEEFRQEFVIDIPYIISDLHMPVHFTDLYSWRGSYDWIALQYFCTKTTLPVPVSDYVRNQLTQLVIREHVVKKRLEYLYDTYHKREIKQEKPLSLIAPLPVMVAMYGSDEVERRTANQIKQLAKYTCKVRNETGEYTIQTLEPTSYVKEKELSERIKHIQEQNAKDGYLRLRKEVELELLARRVPQQPPPPKPQKQAQPAQKQPLAGLAQRIPNTPAQPLPQPRRKPVQ